MAQVGESIFAVEKMSCDHCVRRVTKAVNSLEPEAAVEVDLTTGAVTVTPAAADPGAVAKAITEAGYPARVAK